jgi:hypothetical protein
VEEFAAGFWALNPPERRARWAALAARAVGPAAGRLAELEAGLDVEPRWFAETRADEIGSAIRELFALAPAIRAVRRREWLAKRAGDAGWAAAARALAERDPLTAGLDPLLLQWLTGRLAPAPVREIILPTVVRPVIGPGIVAAIPWVTAGGQETYTPPDPAEWSLWGFDRQQWIGLLIAGFLLVWAYLAHIHTVGPTPARPPAPASTRR